MSLPGPSRTIVVEPLEEPGTVRPPAPAAPPAPAPARDAPAPERRPAGAPSAA
jgi:hypothetical protein